MRMGKRAMMDQALGRWIRENPGRSFAIATPDGIWGYKGEFSSHEEIKASREKEERFWQRWTVDEAADITPEMVELLLGKKRPERSMD